MSIQEKIDNHKTRRDHGIIGGITRWRPSKKLLVFSMSFLLIGSGVILAASGILTRLRESYADPTPLYEVEKGPVRVTVSAGGTLQAMQTHDVKSKVEGSTQILYIIPEGTVVTEENVEEGLVLMELDASNARENVDQQEISVQDASASYTQAKEDYTIQKEQNESDISQAELRLRFARLELERYLGDELAALSIGGELAFEEGGEWRENIGGAAMQRRRSLENSVSLAEEELSRTKESLHWTRELVERGYVNRNELVADELQKKRRVVELESAEEELALFLRYTLLKEAEERHADYLEAKRDLERTRARARGRMAQAEASLRSRESTYNLRKERLERLHHMIENSTVKASRPGLIVYASTTNPRQFRDRPVQEGLSVREGQTIITMPDLSTLAARVEVPETQARMVRPGQPSDIRVDAIPDEKWEGEVRRVSPMATQQFGFRALTGGSSGYETDVTFNGNVDNDLKPGMSATVEIEIASVSNTLSVPIHAVLTRDGRRMCWIAGDNEPKLREVELGYYTDTHVEIRRGLDEGDRVFLAHPQHAPRRPTIVTLPEIDPVERQLLTEPMLETDSEEPLETATEKSTIEHLLEGADPETRERIIERFENADEEVRERILERLRETDPADIERSMERRGSGGGDGSGDGTGDGRGRLD